MGILQWIPIKFRESLGIIQKTYVFFVENQK